MENSINKRKMIINVTVFLVVTLFAVYYLAKSRIITLDSLKVVNLLDFILVFLAFLFALSVLSIVDFIVYRTVTKEMSYARCLINTLCGNLGSSVTPFKSGHFPLMIYVQNRFGLSFSTSLTALVKCQIIYSLTSIIAYVTVVTLLIVTGFSIVFYGVEIALWQVVSLGLFFHVAVFTATTILAFNEKLQKKIVYLWAIILKKFKRISDEREYMALKAQKLLMFKEQLLSIVKHAQYYIAPCFIYFTYMITLGSLQYISYLLISGEKFEFSSLCIFYVLNLASAYITNIIPVPGGAGASEVIFSLIFVSVISDKILGATLVLWRVGSFYFAVIFEVVLFGFTMIIRSKKSKRDCNYKYRR